MIEIENLHKKFGDREILKGVSLKIQKGQAVVIIGPSGTGKSTLLRCINLLEKPDRGHIKLDGFSADLRSIDNKGISILRTRTSMVFQNSNLYRNKTALQNITEPLVRVKKIPKEVAEQKALVLLSQVGMAGKKDCYPETLSGGEKQRVGIARAMGVEPDIILFDEPTSALDPELVTGILDVIRQLAAARTTMLIVTHEMKFAKSVADLVALMDQGVIVEQAPPEEFFTRPRQERTRRFLQNNVE